MGIRINLKRLRGKTKYSQKDIADMLDLNRNTYIKWENGTTDIKSQYIPKLAEIFEVKIQDLFDSDSKKSSIKRQDFQEEIIIKITDSETGKSLGTQLQKIIDSLKK